jgi:N-acetyl-gamma-glutamyl-phosphate reductase (EC 1.2.1.38)
VTAKTRVGIVGATGYTGAELLRRLLRHPQAQVTVATSRQSAGRPVAEFYPHLHGLTDLRFSVPDAAALADCDAILFATPHGTAMREAQALLDAGKRVVDLSADFRLHDPEVFRRWYGMEHASPQLLGEAVYGIPELRREAVAAARLVAGPGCYPTAVQLGLAPLIGAGWMADGVVIADCKSGVSGAGRELRLGSMFVEAADSMKAYAVPGHRHGAEMAQELEVLAGRPVALQFVPHLVPLIRGMQATLYVPLQQAVSAEDLQALFEARYASEPFVSVLPPGSHPETRAVRGSNRCQIAVHLAQNGRMAVVLSVIDNLAKGAAGQALQCLNLMCGLPETAALDDLPLWP